jgi:uncharacterized protein DUF4760
MDVCRYLSDPTSWLAIVTFLMVVATGWLAIEARLASWRQIGVQTWLALESRFDTEHFTMARRKLALLMPYNSSKYEEVSDDVLNFFESVGTLFNEGYIDTNLADSSFSYYAVGWWQATQGYVSEMRGRNGDPSLYKEFEKYVDNVRPRYPRVDEEQFVAGEQNLRV